MARKSLIESSSYYDEILDMIKEGLSPQTISDHLKDEYNEVISGRTIHRHIQKIKSKTSSEYYKKKKAKKEKQKEIVDKGVANKEAYDEIVSEGIGDLDSLDTLISKLNAVGLDVNNLSIEYGPNGGLVTSEADIVRIQLISKKVLIDAIKARNDILKDTNETNVNIGLPVVITKDEEEQLEKEIEDELR